MHHDFNSLEFLIIFLYLNSSLLSFLNLIFNPFKAQQRKRVIEHNSRYHHRREKLKFNNGSSEAHQSALKGK